MPGAYTGKYYSLDTKKGYKNHGHHHKKIINSTPFSHIYKDNLLSFKTSYLSLLTWKAIERWAGSTHTDLVWQSDIPKVIALSESESRGMMTAGFWFCFLGMRLFAEIVENASLKCSFELPSNLFKMSLALRAYSEIQTLQNWVVEWKQNSQPSITQ